MKSQARKKGDPSASLLRTSSWLDAFDVGSPHAVFWTVCSSGAGTSPVGVAAAAGLIGRAAWTVLPSSDSGDKTRPEAATEDCENCSIKHCLRNF